MRAHEGVDACTRIIGVVHDAVAVDPDDIEAPTHVKAELVDADQSRRIEGDPGRFGRGLQEPLGIALVDLTTDGRFIRSQCVWYLQRFARDEELLQLPGVDGEGRPVHVRWLTVVDPPSVGKCTHGPLLIELLEVDLQLDGPVILVARLAGHEEGAIDAADHRHHDRRNQTPVGSDDDLDGDEIAIKADRPGEVPSQEGECGQGVLRQVGESDWVFLLVHRVRVYGVSGIESRPMTFLCASIFVDSADDVPGAIERAREAVDAGADLLEWRLDAVAEDAGAIDNIRAILKECPAPAVATIRAEAEGGTWAGEEADRVAIIEAMGTSDDPPRYIDVELGAWKSSANLRQKVLLATEHERQVRDVTSGLILSSHEFSGRPADLIARLADMVEVDACAVAKIVWRARSIRDNLEAFDLLAQRAKPMIALCMGEFGLMSRILAPKFGGFLTFAAAEVGGGTAPGQPTIDQLLNEYRFASINAETRVYGIVGWPVEHSLGPRVHNAGFGMIDFNGVYVPMPVMPEWEQFKASMVEMLEHPGLDFRGCSVTLPHKEHLLRLVRERGGEIDPLAERIGAANTLVVDDDGGLRCLNTDAPAAAAVLGEVAGKRVMIIGAGGVARAVAVGLVDAGATVYVANRTRSRADALADSIQGVEARGLEEIAGMDVDVFVNCTPLGMASGEAPEATPLPEDVDLDDSHVVFDTVYAPLRTPLLKDAEARGARVVSGIEMFCRQAALQFEAWTGHVPPGGFMDLAPS